MSDAPDDPVAVFLSIVRPRWMRDALCREYPASWWFPTKGKPIARARQVCSACLVRSECDAYAEELGDDLLAGVWAGVAPRERAARARSRPTEKRAA